MSMADPVGAAPGSGTWAQLEVPLDRISWGRTSSVDPAGVKVEVWRASIELPADRLARTKISVGGLKESGARISISASAAGHG